MIGDLETLFEGKEVRVTEQDGEILFPLADLAGAWGVHRNTLPELIDRNKIKFEGFHTVAAHVSCAGMRAVNELGLYLLMGAVNTDRLKDPQAADAILRFQRWVPELIRQYRKGEILPSLQSSYKDLEAALTHHGTVANILINLWEYPPVVARKLAMEAVVLDVGAPALIYKAPAMLPATTFDDQLPCGASCDKCVGSVAEPDPDYDRYFSIRKLAKFTNHTEDQVRNILEKEGLLKWSNGIWHLTMVGQQFGRVFITYPEWPHRTHERKNIRWSPAALQRVKAHIAAGQAALTSG